MNRVSDLIDQLDTSSDTKAEKVIRSLVAIGKSSVPPLIEAAKDATRPRIRKWSLQALGSLGDRRAASLLVAALKDERMTVRLHAVKGLARMKYGKGARPIAALLRDASGGIRVNALYALMILGDPSIAAPVQKALSDPQWYVRQSAAETCGRLGLKKAKKKLETLSKKDDRKAVREAAAEALEKLS